MQTEQTIKTLSGKQLADLKRLFSNYKVTNLGIISSDGSVICEYEHATYDLEIWNNPPKIELKVIVVKR